MVDKIFIATLCLLTISACINQESQSTTSSQLEANENIKKKTSFESQLQETPKPNTYAPDFFSDFDSERAFTVSDLENVENQNVHIIGNIGTNEEINILFEKLPFLPNIEAIEIIGTPLTTNQFQTLIELLSEKPHFKKLSINNANLKSIPSTISRLKHLETLDIPRNQIQTLPKEIGDLMNLKTLRLYNCRRFHTFPDELGQLNQLINLDFAGTRIEYLPNFSGCTALKVITGNACRLKAFPEGIEACINLKNIHLGGNNITKIPAELGQITGLEMLDVANNRINNIPDELASLTNLYAFLISHNQFTAFPEIFFNYKSSLTNLWLHGNDINRLPVEIADFERLDFILVDLPEIEPDDIEAIKAKNPKLRFIDES